ncbi:response regulator transcription factor [Chitinophaga sp. Ak27]|uniref:response regulator transcription factor n=1 Tax=Chitinophaga sp. Ak27 TaxID=2726116 RepID=UPI00145D74D1|nr:response regulator [Chitinophaga sp. Ak27]NLU96160.1 response regulator [Chitinophaga sp. Ak27]
MEEHFDVLLVDDDIDDLDLTSAIIQSLCPAIIVHTLTNGMEALACLERLPDDTLPDLLLIDFNMPLLTGAEVLERLAKEERYDRLFKIVLSTGGVILK